MSSKARRWVVGLIVIGLFLWALTQIPYGIIRQERFRIFGETRTTGVVLAKKILPEGMPRARTRWLVAYKYRDKDGFVRSGTAFFHEAQWQKLERGSMIVVWYPDTQPSLARTEGEVEPPFQKWLREALD